MSRNVTEQDSVNRGPNQNECEEGESDLAHVNRCDIRSPPPITAQAPPYSHKRGCREEAVRILLNAKVLEDASDPAQQSTCNRQHERQAGNDKEECKGDHKCPHTNQKHVCSRGKRRMEFGWRGVHRRDSTVESRYMPVFQLPLPGDCAQNPCYKAF